MSGLSDLDRLHTPYSPLISQEDDEEEGEDSEEEEEEELPPKVPPLPPSHVMIHMVPEGSKSRWSHIDDLDSFFKQVYEYHQKDGFSVMILREFMELIQFAFIVYLTTYLWHCIDYDLLFNKKPSSRSGDKKLTLSDCVYPLGLCVQSFSLSTWLCLFVAFSFWTVRVFTFCYRIFQFWDIKSFYNTALDIGDEELPSVSWIEVQKRLVQAQGKHSMCIHKDKLSELDIYHRILRFKNYMVAMVNKDLLPFTINVPFIGETIFFSQALKFNVEILLFKSPWAPFDKWNLKEDYKRLHKKQELVEGLKSKILLLAILNFLLMPLILLYQILRFFFYYVELVKREPGTLGVRRWSPYARLFLRHFNEHDHELKSRLNRAYKSANTYLDGFVSPVLAVIAQNTAFFAGSILAVFIVLTVWDEDVLNVEHVLTVMTALTGIVAFMRLFIADENVVFCPEKSLTTVLAHIHYFPVSWKTHAHTPKVMEQLQSLFPYTFVWLLQEILSPVLTPFILIFYLRPRAPAIVDFFRSFTVSVTGVGDVCSFAQMDCRRHGDPIWQAGPGAAGAAEKKGHVKAEDGKTEMSLVHFALTNPNWKIPATAEPFINALKGQANKDAEQLPTLTEEEDNPLVNSLNSLNDVGGVYANLANSAILDIRESRAPYGGGATSFLLQSPYSHNEESSSSKPPPSLLSSRIVGASSVSLAPLPNLRQDLRRLGLEYTAADMSFSALYLHEMHYRTLNSRQGGNPGGRPITEEENDDQHPPPHPSASIIS